ncbi:uncharacterized protein LOC125235486 isoform X2 [Leguminivora glycinivorella]|uniref:uncharacterized protein LOC125235486 isoform X2 n=1 Tax=Leguminivora glycinivorella TaxID=1035111 RepID=UPI00200D5ADF|nr:uncharacterized protein LOC125235486 isoform X2 [Leguminivora glycinivorella]
MSTSKQLLGSYSVPNVSLVYVCLVGNITPGNPGKSNVGCGSGHSRPSLHIIDNVDEVGTSKDNDTAIEVQRSVAFHELVESPGKFGILEYFPDKIEEQASETIPLPHHKGEADEENVYGNPKILSLTKTKWLSESRDGSPDARECLIQSTTSESSLGEELPEHTSTHKALSTVLALDKEHNLFGLSNTYIQLTSPKWRKCPKDSDSKAVFHQTAIVQACYKTCCRRRSKTDLPSSLKCGGCKSRCSCARCRSCISCTSLLCKSSCSTCVVPCNPCLPCGSSCVVPCPLFFNKPCPPKTCPSRPCPSYLSVMKKPKFAPVYSEIEPKASCILSKPFLARSCNHHPRCIPPSTCFPYLMPCFWPTRSGAPCCEPSQCFHNPPCPRGRSKTGRVHPQELCPHGLPCVGKDKSQKCENYSCIGRNNEALAKALADFNTVKK